MLCLFWNLQFGACIYYFQPDLVNLGIVLPTGVWLDLRGFGKIINIEVISEQKDFYISVFDLFPLIYIFVDIDFCLFSELKAAQIHLRHRKTNYLVALTLFSELC